MAFEQDISIKLLIPSYARENEVRKSVQDNKRKPLVLE